MKPSHFVNQIRKIVIEESNEFYKESFNTNITATDKYWKKAIEFFNKLDNEGKQMLFEIIKEVEVDTISCIFGILDGVIWIDGQENDFILTIEDSESIINGDLQSIFLEKEEDDTCSAESSPRSS